MNWKLLVILLSFACACYAADEHGHEGQHHDEPGHEGHGHGGPPPKGLTIASLMLTAGGGLLVSAALLAIFWKPIDAAFRKSRLRPNWERQTVRLGFGVAFVIVATAIMATIAHTNMERTEHKELAARSDPMRPAHGGVVKKAERFAIELVARRTGEVRFYMTVLEGAMPGLWDVKPSLSVPVLITNATTSIVTNEIIPMKPVNDGSCFAAMTSPLENPRTRMHLSVKVKDRNQGKEEDKVFNLDYDLPVRD